MRVVQTLMAAQVITGGKGIGSAGMQRRELEADGNGTSETGIAPVPAAQRAGQPETKNSVSLPTTRALPTRPQRQR